MGTNKVYLSLLLLGIRLDRSSAQDCFSHTDCTSCVDDGCAWAAGGCLDHCEMIADVECWSEETFLGGGQTTEAICQAEQDVIADHQACSSKSSCSDCVSTNLPSSEDGSQSCVWFGDEVLGPNEQGFCEMGCTMIGCGTTTCPSDDEVAVDNRTSCEDASTCTDCIAEGCAWAVGECMDNCSMIADAACYSTEYFEGQTPDEICQAEEDQLQDSNACAGLSSCSECVSTALPSNASTTCMWFGNEDQIGLGSEGFCDSGCNMLGCGMATCPSDEGGIFENATICEDASSCIDCVATGCSWTVGECMKSCGVADASCYSTKYFEGQTPDEICQVEEDQLQDSNACAGLSSCSECVSTALPSNASTTCMWFGNDDQILGLGGEGFCDSGCGMMGCGMTTCLSDNSTAETRSGNKASADSSAPGSRLLSKISMICLFVATAYAAL